VIGTKAAWKFVSKRIIAKALIDQYGHMTFHISGVLGAFLVRAPLLRMALLTN